MPTTHNMASEDLASISSMHKADLQEELASSGMSVNQSWTVPELRELVKELRGPTVKNPMSKFASMARPDLVLELQRRMPHERVPPKATRGWMLLRLRDLLETPQDGTTVMVGGKHKGLLWSELLDQKPRWVIWANQVEAGGPRVNTTQRQTDEGPDEESPPSRPEPSVRAPPPKATAPPPNRRRTAPRDDMDGAPTEDARAEVARLEAEVARLRGNLSEWELMGDSGLQVN